MMSLHHGWGWQTTQTASHIHIRHIQCVWAHWYAVHGHKKVTSNNYTHTTCVRFCGYGSLVEWNDGIMSWLRLTATQIAFHIHIRHIQSVWALWYAVHGHMAVASNSYTHNTWLRFCGSVSLVESKYGIMSWLSPDSQLKLLPASTLDIYKSFEHIDVLSKCLSTLICYPCSYGISLK